MRRFVTRTQCSNTTRQDTRLWDGKGARHHPERLRTPYSTTTGHVSVRATVHTALKHDSFSPVYSLQTVLNWATVGISKLQIRKNMTHFFSKSFVWLTFFLPHHSILGDHLQYFTIRFRPKYKTIFTSVFQLKTYSFTKSAKTSE